MDIALGLASSEKIEPLATSNTCSSLRVQMQLRSVVHQSDGWVFEVI
jgi:hypothetical protein